jgi:predicted Zn-dependent protease
MLAPAPTGDDRQAGAAASTGKGSSVAGAQGETRAAGMGPMARPGGVVRRLLRRRQLWAAGVVLCLVAACLPWAIHRSRAWSHFRAARAETERYHTSQAIRHLQVCMGVWPEDPDVLLLAARVVRRANRYPEAERLLEKYQQARGLDEAGSLEQLLLSAERRVDQVADLCWHRVQEGHPHKALILEALVRGYLRQYRLGEARLCLDYWRQSEPENAHTYCLEGLLHIDYAHAVSAAEESYRRALELDPDHEEARIGFAVTLLTANKYQEAVGHLEELRRRQPDNLSVQVGLAECRAASGDVAEAMRLVDDVLSRQPELAAALTLRGRLALEDGQPAEAETWLRRAVARNPSDVRARYSLILCLLQNGKEEERREQQRQLDQLEHDEKRLNDIVTKEIAQRPRDPALHFSVGQLLLRGGNREEGLRWLHSALQLDPQYAPARQALAEYQQKAKAEQRPNPGQ